jgi:hypothetical protein
VLQVNGREFINHVDWKAVFEKTKRQSERFKKTVQDEDVEIKRKWKNNKQQTLSYFVTKELDNAASDAKFFMDRAKEHKLTLGGLTSLEKKELLEKMVEQIENSQFVKGFVSQHEIKTAVEKRLDDDFEIVPTTVYTVKKRT